MNADNQAGDVLAPSASVCGRRVRLRACENLGSILPDNKDVTRFTSTIAGNSLTTV